MEPLCERFSTTTFDEQGQLKAFQLHYEDNFNFGYDVVDAIAAQEPGKRAVQWCDESGAEKMLTFSEISKLSNQAVGALQSLGIAKGDRVMVMLKRHWEYWFMAPALHKLGAVIVPATHMLREHDITYRIEAANIKAIVCAESEDLCDRIRTAAKEVENPPLLLTVRADREGFQRLDVLMQTQPTEIDRIPTKATDQMLMYFTSGTTGNPKMVVHSYTYPLGHIVTAKYWQCVLNDGLHLTVADTGWAKCSWGKIYGQWLCGSAVMVYEFERFHAEEMMKVLEKYQVTTFCAPPTLYRLMAKTGIRREAFASVQHVSTAGEALQEEIIRLFHEATGLEIMEGFGQTETTLTIGNLSGTVPKIGSMGKANPQYDVDIVDPDGNPVATGEVGEIVIRTDKNTPCGLYREYYLDEEKTKEAWHDGMYHTGDTAWRDEDGYFWYVSRIDDVIKSSGYRIGPFEIESVIMELPYVLECGVSAEPDDVRGQIVKASIVLTKGTVGTEELKKEIQQYVKEHTAPYKYPRKIVFREDLPKTISGKIQRNLL